MIERTTDGIALVAVLSWFNPKVYSWIYDVSQLAATAMPILGVVWMTIQISGAVKRNWKSIRKFLRTLMPWGKANV